MLQVRVSPHKVSYQPHKTTFGQTWWVTTHKIDFPIWLHFYYQNRSSKEVLAKKHQWNTSTTFWDSYFQQSSPYLNAWVLEHLVKILTHNLTGLQYLNESYRGWWQTPLANWPSLTTKLLDKEVLTLRCSVAVTKYKSLETRSRPQVNLPVCFLEWLHKAFLQHFSMSHLKRERSFRLWDTFDWFQGWLGSILPLDSKIIRQRLSSQGWEAGFSRGQGSPGESQQLNGKGLLYRQQAGSESHRRNDERLPTPQTVLQMPNTLFFHFPKWVWRMTYPCKWVSGTKLI